MDVTAQDLLVAARAAAAAVKGSTEAPKEEKKVDNNVKVMEERALPEGATLVLRANIRIKAEKKEDQIAAYLVPVWRGDIDGDAIEEKGCPIAGGLSVEDLRELARRVRGGDKYLFNLDMLLKKGNAEYIGEYSITADGRVFPAAESTTRARRAAGRQLAKLLDLDA